MKKTGFLVFALLIANYGFTQECKVLKAEISTSYQGECKNGLAHGKGIAKGQDSYDGEFKKGLPDGKGTYIWANGSIYEGNWRSGVRDGKGKYTWHTAKGDSTLVGVWRRDKYAGTGIAPYTINLNQSISRYSIRKGLGLDNKITIQFMRAGTNFSDINNLNINTDSGATEINGAYLNINNAVFPLEIKLDFSVPSLLNTYDVKCIFNLTIREKGSWEIVINI